MKIKKPIKKINKSVIIIAAALALGVVALPVYAFVLKPLSNKTTNTIQTENTSSDAQQSENLEANPDSKSTAPNTDIPAEPTTNGESGKKQVQMVTSVDQSNGMVFIRGGVNYPVTGGTCYAQLLGPSGQSIRKDSIILSNPASTDCKTISIPVNELESGRWTFTLNYTSDEYEGVSIETSFTL